MRKPRRTKDSQRMPEEKKQPFWNSKTIWAVVIIGLMVLSGVGFYYAGREDLAPGYNGYRFSLNTNQQYELQWEGQRLLFDFHPTELERLAIDPSVISLVKQTPQFLISIDANTSSPEYMDLLRFRLGEQMTKQSIAVGMGVLQQHPQYLLPIITCMNASSTLPVLTIQMDGTQGIIQEGYCLRMNGKNSRELSEIGQRLEYALLGVIR